MSTVTLEENRLTKRQYDPAVVKVAKFPTPVTATKGEMVLHGPSAAALAALDAMLAKSPGLGIRRTGPGEYVYWRKVEGSRRG